MIDEVMMMRPQPCGFMTSNAAFAAKKVPLRLVSITSSQSCSDIASMGAIG